LFRDPHAPDSCKDVCRCHRYCSYEHRRFPAERLLAGTTKGFISTQDIHEAHKKYATQLRAMANDPLMEPFIGDSRCSARVS